MRTDATAIRPSQENHQAAFSADAVAAPVAGSPVRRLIRRLMDLGIAVPLCALLLPVFVVTALAIKLESRGPVFFVQTRRGRGFRPIRVIKFRSLRPERDPHPCYAMRADDPRITRVGAILRRTSVDELPQLFNVLGGTMSIVGPRPLVEWESRACLAVHAERFLVKPGITGLSRVEVRKTVGFHARLDRDVEYVRHWSLGLDLAIIWKTPWAVLRGDGIYPEAGDTPRRGREHSNTAELPAG